ncbi:MAG TPA: hypothetical protein VHF89_05535 [Solirubrobacteraceae bacterium]|nr:hypothetical protein [Solirubrobacteraceae bacterium]
MGVLARLLGRIDRRRGVLAEEPADAGEHQPQIPRPPDTAGTARIEQPQPTPSMRLPEMQRTAGTPDYRTPHGTPSTQRLHNPQRPGR